MLKDFNKYKVKTDTPEEKSTNSILSWVVVIAVVSLVYGGFIAYSWYSSEPMPDCGYTDRGCQGDNNRFGQ